MLYPHYKYILLPALALGVISSQALAKTEPIVLKPLSKWSISYNKDNCSLDRAFGEGDDTIVLVMHRYTNNNRFNIQLIGKPFDFIQKNKPATLQFGPNNNEQELSYFIGNRGDYPAIFYTNSLNIRGLSKSDIKALKKNSDFEPQPISEVEEKNTTSLIIGKPLRQIITLNTGAMKKPLAALRKCMDDLMQDWGYNAEEQNNLNSQAKPTNNPGKWISATDYPPSALRKGQSAIVNFRLNIDENGTVKSCNILQSIGDEEFDRVSCQRIMKKAKFSPALNKDNQPVSSFWVNRIIFKIQ